MKKAIKLLRDVFTRDGRVFCSAADTSQGTKHLWGLLELAGCVEKHTASGRGCLGHPFSYRITDEGRKVAETKAVANP